MILSNDCSWTPHIQKMIQSASTMSSWVLSVFKDRSPFLMLTLFKTMVRSKLEYCCPVWNPAKTMDIEAIENVQRQYTRRINGCSGLDYWERLRKLNIISLQRRRERYILIHTWKILNGLAPNDIGMLFKNNPRHGIKATVPALNYKSQRSVATHYENSFGVKSAQLWNLLPKEINSISTLDLLKPSLAKFLKNSPTRLRLKDTPLLTTTHSWNGTYKKTPVE